MPVAGFPISVSGETGACRQTSPNDSGNGLYSTGFEPTLARTPWPEAVLATTVISLVTKLLNATDAAVVV